jgi:hypothetical protein
VGKIFVSRVRQRTTAVVEAELEVWVAFRVVVVDNAGRVVKMDALGIVERRHDVSLMEVC